MFACLVPINDDAIGIMVEKSGLTRLESLELVLQPEEDIPIQRTISCFYGSSASYEEENSNVETEKNMGDYPLLDKY